MDKKLAHLNMIQMTINRFSGNSFLLKGWSVVLVSALFALAAKDSESMFIYLAYFPAIAFWILDGYYLWQERLYRRLYNQVRDMQESDITYSMDTFVIQVSEGGWCSAIFSKTLFVFHGTIIGSVIIVMLIIATKK